MKKIFYIIIILSVISTLSAQNKKLTLYYSNDSTNVVNIAGLDSMVIFICGASKVSYGGKDYNTVLIGNQCWLKENLDVGTMIYPPTHQQNNFIIEKYCYINESSYCDIYGGLYQWNEAMQYVTTLDAKGICPNSWHMPSEAEYNVLIVFVNNDGNALKREDQGSGSGQGTNTSKFSGLLAGHCDIVNSNVYWSAPGSVTLIWSSKNGASWAQALSLSNFNNNIGLDYFDREQSVYSVRCIKDN